MILPPRPDFRPPWAAALGAVFVCALAALAWAAAAAPEPAAVAELALVGVPEDLAAQLASGLSLAPRGSFLRRTRSPLTDRSLADDRQRILLFLALHGHPDATVQSAVTPRPDGDGVKLTFTVSAGPPVVYGPVTLAGFPPAELPAAERLARTALPPEGRFDEPAVLDLRDGLQRQLQEAAYVTPEVRIQVVRVAPGVATVDIVANPGIPSAFDSVRVRGVPADIAPVAVRVIDLQPGTPYSPELLARTSQALRNLELFRRVDLRAVELAPGRLRLDADLVVRPLVTTRVSVGSWTDDWIRVSAGWSHRNLLRRGRGLDLGASYSPHLLVTSAGVWWPALLTPRSRADLEVSYRVEDEESYRLALAGAAVTNLFTLDPKTSLRVGVAVTRGNLVNRSTDAQAFVDRVGLQTILTARWFRDSADDVLLPSRGHRLGLEANASVPGILTDNPFLSLRAAEARYLPLNGKRLVLAGRLDVGVAWPLGQAHDLTPNHRFFAGGVTTMRGYHRRQLGPRDGDGLPLGGEAQILAGLELRQQLVGSFGVAAFLDAGQVWQRHNEVDLAEIKYAAGIGVMVASAIGPIRLDVARNLTSPPAGEPRTLLQLAIGHPY